MTGLHKTGFPPQSFYYGVLDIMREAAPFLREKGESEDETFQRVYLDHIDLLRQANPPPSNEFIAAAMLMTAVENGGINLSAQFLMTQNPVVYEHFMRLRLSAGTSSSRLFDEDIAYRDSVDIMFMRWVMGQTHEQIRTAAGDMIYRQDTARNEALNLKGRRSPLEDAYQEAVAQVREAGIVIAPKPAPVEEPTRPSWPFGY